MGSKYENPFDPIIMERAAKIVGQMGQTSLTEAPRFEVPCGMSKLFYEGRRSNGFTEFSREGLGSSNGNRRRQRHRRRNQLLFRCPCKKFAAGTRFDQLRTARSAFDRRAEGRGRYPWPRRRHGLPCGRNWCRTRERPLRTGTGSEQVPVQKGDAINDVKMHIWVV